MFEHSVRVPRQFKIAANIFKKVSTEGGSVKTLLYDSKLRHFRTNVLYALISETIKHAGDIDKIFESTSILKNETRLDPWLAKVLTTELLFGKKSLPGQSKPEQTILSYKEQFDKFTDQHQGILKDEVVRRPRYVRINTNLFTTSDAIREFQDEGYQFIRCTSGPYDDYLNQIRNLSEYDFTQDYHVKTVFVFSPGTKLHEHELYLESKIILQDKATALAVHLLAPPAGSVAMDMCAAPGMKTTQLAAYMRNEGKIYAIERNEGRYKTLVDFVERTGSKCVETINKDTLEIKRGEFDDVEYILLDPSCSGSGMELCVHNYIEETRLAKLTSLQEKFLKHAMNSFPKAKRIVYSTCSIYSEENERVVTNAVRTSRSKWRVQDVKQLLKGQWNNFGSSMYGSIGVRCLYSRPNTDFTTGFFLAVLDKDTKDLTKQRTKNEGFEVSNDDFIKTETEDVKNVKEKKKIKKYTSSEDQCNYGDQVDDINEGKKKSRKKYENENDGYISTKQDKNGIEERQFAAVTQEAIQEMKTEDIDQVIKKEKKKKRKKCDDIEKDINEGSNSIKKDENSIELVVTADDIQETKFKKKKKKKACVESFEEDLKIDQVLTDKKLKKMKKKLSVDTEGCTQFEDLMETAPKKKKKKKRNSNENS